MQLDPSITKAVL